jgi:O-antigen/teichoic acid export membrane protein
VSSVNKNVMYNLLSTLLSMLSPLIVIPYLTMELGMGAYGEYVAIISLAALLSALGDLGLGMFLPKEISINRDNNSKLTELISSFLIIRTFTSSIAIILSFYLINGSVLLHALVACYILIQGVSFTLVFTGLERYKYLSISDVISKCLLIVMVVLVDYSNLGLEKAIGIQILVTLTLNFLLLKEFVRHYNIRIKWVTTNDLLNIIKPSGSFYFVNLLSNLYTHSSTYFVSLIVSSEQVALYSIATQLYRVGHSVIGGVVRVIYTSTIRTKNFVMLKKITMVSLSIHLCLIPIVYFFGEDILSLIFESDTYILSSLATILYITLFFVIISSYWGYPALTAIHKEKNAHFGVVFSFLIYALSFSFVYLLDLVSLYSLVYCIVISEFTGMLFRVYYINKFRHLFYIK